MCFFNFGEISESKNKANASISICLTVHCYFIGIAGCGVTVYVMVFSGSSPNKYYSTGKIRISLLLCNNPSFIQKSWSETDFIVPVYCEGVETERLEIVKVLQLTADALLHQWSKVHQTHFTCTERKAQGIVAHILSCNNFEQWIFCHHTLVLLITLMVELCSTTSSLGIEIKFSLLSLIEVVLSSLRLRCSSVVPSSPLLLIVYGIHRIEHLPSNVIPFFNIPKFWELFLFILWIFAQKG